MKDHPTSHVRHSRRDWLCTSAAAMLALGASYGPRAAFAAPAVDRRLQNRLELWHTYARNSDNLLARYHMRRNSSLLKEPLVTDGTLAARAPDRLVFKDDGFSGALTRIESATASYAPLADDGPPRQLQRAERASVDWLSDRLMRVFFKGDAAALIEGARTSVPRSRSPRLELRPPLDHPARSDLRGLTLTFDPVGGAVLRLDIAEAQGGQIRFDFADHRQSVDPRELRDLVGD